MISPVSNFEEDGSSADIRTYIQQPFGDGDLSGMVDADIAKCAGELRAGRREQVTMAELARKNPEAYQSMAQKIQEMGNIFLEYVTGKDIPGAWRYVTDVILYDSKRNLDKILGILCTYGGARRQGMLGFSVEPDHVHVIHDCAFSDGTCRHAWRKQVEPYGTFKPVRKQVKPIYKFTRTDWYDVFQYFFLAKRGTRKIWARGKSWEAPTDAQLLRWEEELNSWGSLVRGEDSGSDSERERQSHKRPHRSTSLPRDDEIYGEKSRKVGKFTYIREKTKALLLKYYCCPTSAIMDTIEFRQDEILCNPKNKDYIQSALMDFGKDLNEYKLRDFEYILEGKNPIFMSGVVYGNREESLEWIERLLRHQFNDDDEQICYFLRSLVDVIDKKLPKCNTLSVKSPPSAGKNFFFDMIFAIILNYGQLGQANKHNLFAFQEAPGKRILLWNEPNYCSSLTDTIKMMTGGDVYTVRVKHMMDQHVKRTPLIVLTNEAVPFLYELAFKERIVQFNWKYSPFLKDIECKPYPLSFFDLLKKYKIQY